MKLALAVLAAAVALCDVTYGCNVTVYDECMEDFNSDIDVEEFASIQENPGADIDALRTFCSKFQNLSMCVEPSVRGCNEMWTIQWSIISRSLGFLCSETSIQMISANTECLAIAKDQEAECQSTYVRRTRQLLTAPQVCEHTTDYADCTMRAYRQACGLQMAWWAERYMDITFKSTRKMSKCYFKPAILGYGPP